MRVMIAAVVLMLVPATVVGQRPEKAAPACAGAVQALDDAVTAEANLLASHDKLMQQNAQLAKLYAALSAKVSELSKLSAGKAPGDPGVLAAQKQLQEMNQSFNMQYLGLQQQMQDESRRFTLLSNIIKTKHDTAKNSISNVR